MYNWILKTLVVFFGLSLSSAIASYHVPSLPGGLCFPAFSSSALVNSAALAQDWRSEGKVLYSPPLSQDTPHAYSTSAGYSNGIFGLNLGYLGSYQSDIAFHGGFLGGAFKIKKLSFGYTARKLDLEETSLSHDASIGWNPNYYSRVSASLYGLNEETQLAMGFGFGRPQKQTLGLDILIPIKPMGDGMRDQYSVTLTLGKYFEKWGYSAGINFTRQQDGFENPDLISGQLNITKVLKKNLGGILQMRSRPEAVMIGLVWMSIPSSSQYIKRFKDTNRKTIWRD